MRDDVSMIAKTEPRERVSSALVIIISAATGVILGSLEYHRETTIFVLVLEFKLENS